MASQKNEVQSLLMQERLNLRLADDSNPAPCARAYDTNGEIYLTVTLGSGNNSVEAIIAFAQAAAPASGAKDALGLDQRVYSPHVISVLFDITSGASTAATTKLAVLGECLLTGMNVVEYDKDAGASNIALADITGANKVAEFQNLWWKGGASV